MPSKKKLRRRIEELEAQVARLAVDLRDEQAECRTYNRLLMRIRSALADRVPSQEIGITFSGWVARIIQLVERYAPILSTDPRSAMDARIKAIIRSVEELKQEAIADQSFDRAAHLRDVADRLTYVSAAYTKELEYNETV